MKLYEEKIRYPKKGDKFFKEDGDQHEIAWLNKSFQEFGNYADGYQTSAISLIDLALKDKSVMDYHIYPAIFLIRHYLELRLKELIQGLNFCINQTRDFPAHHQLQNLYGEFRAAYKAIGEDPTTKDFQIIHSLINEISAVDPSSMAFRYPVDKSGQKTQVLEYVNLNNLRETFVRVCFVFDGVAMLIDNHVENTQEMLASLYENWQ
jgi:hypothetical protein